MERGAQIGDIFVGQFAKVVDRMGRFHSKIFALLKFAGQRVAEKRSCAQSNRDRSPDVNEMK